MNVGDKFTICRTTFAFGNSKSAIIIPAPLDIPTGAELKMVVEIVSLPGSGTIEPA